MLGSEYNWLISLSRAANGAPRVRVASDALLTLVIAALCFVAVVLPTL